MESLAKITSKGQVTIPKKIREFLGTDVVRFRVVKGKVVLEPVRDVRGIFKKYVKTSGSIRGVPSTGRKAGRRSIPLSR
ncbi:MAG TPA: AbrB/MazE/SpoVT family DNA-binding domain-containing protein [Thermodesulfobacteriaceae bacterium]|nr:AbrB/MazE/SpoVT family DNA-binding domain-containing protein [Thermodesulfobacteriaceae bacterium]